MSFLQGTVKTCLLVLFLSILTTTAEKEIPSTEAPCDYMDTVLLDESQKLSNGSYLYEGILLPANKIGTYNYEITVGNEKQTLNTSQIRGCICEYRPCISICCNESEEYFNDTCIDSDIIPYSNIDIMNNRNKIVSVNISEHFVLQYYKTCKGLYYYEPDEFVHDNYTILENGSLFRYHDKIVLPKNEYCLSPKLTHKVFKYTPLECYYTNDLSNMHAIKMNGIALTLSVPFMILTIIVYLILPDLRSIHGLSFCCYLAGLSLGYSLLSFMIFNVNISNMLCTVLGYVTYFAFMSAFFWLSVISYDLYNYIQGSKIVQEMKQFRLYVLYAYGLTTICTIYTYLLHNSSFLPHSWKDGMGVNYCFISPQGWSALLYFYGPIMIIVSFNTIIFILTIIEIKKKVNLNYLKGSNDLHQKHEELTMTYLRLFIIMGITWMMEIFTYLLPRGSKIQAFFDVIDILNGIQGLIIFILFVCRNSVRKMLIKRFGKRDERSLDETEEMSYIK